MSLINQMLQDLDARRAAHGVGTHLPNDVRPLPPARPSRWPMVAGVLGAALPVVAFVCWQWAPWRPLVASAPLQEQVPPPVVLAPPATPPVTPAPAGGAADAMEPDGAGAHATAVPPSATPVVASAESTPVAAEFADRLRRAESLQMVPEPQELATRAEPPGNTVKDRVKAEAKEVAKGAGKGGANDVADARVMAAPRDAATTESVRTRAPEAVPASVPAGGDKADRRVSIERTDAPASSRERAELDYRKAIAAVNHGRVDEALDGLRAALKQDALHVAARQLLVKLALENGRAGEAIQCLQDGVQQQPAQIGWAVSLARLQVDQGRLADAWQTLERSAPAAGANADYQGFAGHVLSRLGRSKEAAERYLQATRLAPADGRWWLGLGLAQEAEGRAADARESFLRARQAGNLGPELAALVEQKLR